MFMFPLKNLAHKELIVSPPIEITATLFLCDSMSDVWKMYQHFIE